MKKLMFVFCFFCVMGMILAQNESNAEPKESEVAIGFIKINKIFIHADKEYEPGTYWFALTEKAGAPYFKVYNRKKEFLFDEMAIVKPNALKKKNIRKHSVSKGLTPNGEYFRIRVTRRDDSLFGYFLVKKEGNSEQKPTTEE
ncbi:MAG: hypothetical protein ACM3SY_18790 [Candidatus Omnitrophota bacterium]